MDLFEALHTRRSIRKYTGEDVPDELIDRILTAGTMAPYGRNQIWRFAVIRDEKVKIAIADLTVYGKIITSAPVIIGVFHDRNESYHEIKDAQTMGACIQNMLLAIHGLGLAGVWIGEVLKNGEQAATLLGAPESYELSAIVTVGRPGKAGGSADRKLLEDVVFLRR